MKKSIIIFSFVLIVIGVAVSIVILNKSKPKIDENMLYTKKFGNTILKFQRYDYVLGQNILVGVEKSINKGKDYTRITNELVTVSKEAKFLFYNESLSFIISTGNISRHNNFMGFKVSQDGGKTFTNAKFNYENERISLITIEDFPYYDGSILKLKCSVYDINQNNDGYEDIELIFSSNDNGLTWNL